MIGISRSQTIGEWGLNGRNKKDRPTSRNSSQLSMWKIDLRWRSCWDIRWLIEKWTRPSTKGAPKNQWSWSMWYDGSEWAWCGDKDKWLRSFMRSMTSLNNSTSRTYTMFVLIVTMQKYKIVVSMSHLQVHITSKSDLSQTNKGSIHK